MDGLGRFDIASYRGAMMVVVESDLLPPDPAVVVIPLVPGYPAITHLNPTFMVGEEPMVLATRLIGAVRRSALTRVGSLQGEADRITRAVDVLMGGI